LSRKCHAACARASSTILMSAQPTQIVTANIGCQLHLAAEAQVPVRHWLEVVAAALTPRGA
jgi:glycolate oxidase iron-sulfur subunit